MRIIKKKKEKKNNVVTADQAWPGKVFLDTFLASEVRNRVFDVSWGVYSFLDYRPRACKDLRDENARLYTHTHTHTHTLFFSFSIFLLSHSVSFYLILSTRLTSCCNKQTEREDLSILRLIYTEEKKSQQQNGTLILYLHSNVVATH